MTPRPTISRINQFWLAAADAKGMPGIVRKLIRSAAATRTITIGGVRLKCHADNATEYSLAIGRRHELVSAARILGPLRAGDVFVDIGANCGLFSLIAAKRVGSTGRVVAIEPGAEMVRRLNDNLRANGFTNVELVPSAIGKSDGTTVLHVPRSQHGESSLFTSDLTDVVSEPVPIRPLASVLRSLGLDRITVLKIDIEGAEDQALIPFFEATERALWPRQIFMETQWRSRWEDDCLGYLKGIGYEVKWQDEADAILVLKRRP